MTDKASLLNDSMRFFRFTAYIVSCTATPLSTASQHGNLPMQSKRTLNETNKLARLCINSRGSYPSFGSHISQLHVWARTCGMLATTSHEINIVLHLGSLHVVSFQQLIPGSKCTSPCTCPRMFLLTFLETNPCPTLYPTLVSRNN